MIFEDVLREISVLLLWQKEVGAFGEEKELQKRYNSH